MKISFITINRFVEEKAAEDAAYRKLLERKGKIVLSIGRRMTDEALVAKLRSLGIDMDRERFRRSAERFFSAEAMARSFYKAAGGKITDSDADWVWIAFCCLWERWLGDRPSFEMLDDWMQEGYRVRDEDVVAACEIWLKTWHTILGVMAEQGIASIDDFDDIFCVTQSLFNWVQDLESELYRAAIERPEFNRERITLCQFMLGQLPRDDGRFDTFRNALAESYFDLGETATAEQLYRQWLADDAQWGWGWIRWSDNYHFIREAQRDLARAEQILQEGLAVPGVRDKEFLLDRLESVYEDSGRCEEAAAIRDQLERLRQQASTMPVGRTRETTPEQIPTSLRLKRTYDFGEEGLPLQDFAEFADSARHSEDILSAMLAGAPDPASPIKAPSGAQFAAPEDDDSLQSPVSVRRTGPRIGRNDPCPCRSGKKFKHCCGRAGK